MNAAIQEPVEISRHMVDIYLAAKRSGQWMTAKELAAAAGVARRTVAAHGLRFVVCGIFEEAKVFPGHRYRLCEHVGPEGWRLQERIKDACGAMQIEF